MYIACVHFMNKMLKCYVMFWIEYDRWIAHIRVSITTHIQHFTLSSMIKEILAIKVKVPTPHEWNKFMLQLFVTCQ